MGLTLPTEGGLKQDVPRSCDCRVYSPEGKAYPCTHLQETMWASQHEVYTPGVWAKGYWEDWQAPHRQALLEVLARHHPFESLIELGCNSGPNLRAIHARWPEVRLAGIDISGEALRYGKEAAREEGWDWTAYRGGFGNIAPADVLLSCYSLCYVDYRDIRGVLESILSAAPIVILAEPTPQHEGSLVEAVAHEARTVGEWWYDYPTLLGGLTRGWYRVDRLTHPHGNVTQIMTWLRGASP